MSSRGNIVRYLVILGVFLGTLNLTSFVLASERRPAVLSLSKWARALYPFENPQQGSPSYEKTPFSSLTLGSPVDEPRSHEAIEEYNNSLDELLTHHGLARYVFHRRQGEFYKNLSKKVSGELYTLAFHAAGAIVSFHLLLTYTNLGSETLSYINLGITTYLLVNMYRIVLKSTLINYRHFQSRRYIYYHEEFQNPEALHSAIRRMSYATKWAFDSLTPDVRRIIYRINLETLWKILQHCQCHSDLYFVLNGFEKGNLGIRFFDA